MLVMVMTVVVVEIAIMSNTQCAVCVPRRFLAAGDAVTR